MQITRKKILKYLLIGIFALCNLIIIITCYNQINQKLTHQNNQLQYSGTITDTIYSNSDLGWTFSFPSTYTVVNDKEVESFNQIGNSLFNKNEDDIIKPIKLLNINSSDVTFMSALHMRESFPSIKTEDDFFKKIESDMTKINDSTTVIKKTNSGSLDVDGKDFKYIEYVVESKDYGFGVICISRVTDNYILDISITYTNLESVQVLLKCLMNSKFDK